MSDSRDTDTHRPPTCHSKVGSCKLEWKWSTHNTVTTRRGLLLAGVDRSLNGQMSSIAEQVLNVQDPQAYKVPEDKLQALIFDCDGE
jgi:hypothetical protein